MIMNYVVVEAGAHDPDVGREHPANHRRKTQPVADDDISALTEPDVS
jgi:hypothetical protein